MVTDTVTVASDAHSTASIAGVQFLLDTRNLGPESPGATQSVPWDTRTAWNGDHVLSAIARDPTGNTAVAPPVTVTVNNLSSAVTVATQHNDAARTGANLAETTLSPARVRAAEFGKIFERSVDDEIWGQPLYVPNVSVPGAGLRNVVYVATASDSVYTFDADNPGANAPLWRVSYIDPSHDVVPGARADVACDDLAGNIGITGTPAIDPQNQAIYFVAVTKESGTYVQRLHALDLRDGTELPNSPVRVQATSFDPQTESQRAALLLSNGIVYVAWGSYCHTLPGHGWVIGYDARSLQQISAVTTSPDGILAGISQSGQGLSADSEGYVYAITGGGTFDADASGADYGSSFLKFAPAGGLIDWFTPFNVAALSAAGLELGTQGALPIPGTRVVIGGGKEGRLYVLDRDNMGHTQAGDDSQILQSFTVSPGRLDASPIYWDSPVSGPTIYVWPDSTTLRAYRLVGGTFDTATVGQSSVTASGAPGGVLSLSADGATPGTGIVWASVSNGGSALSSTQPGILRAFDADDLSHELWNSEQNPTRDRVGAFSKNSAPTIANGKVYVATFSGRLVIYGPIPPSGPVAVPSVLNSTQSAASIALSSAGLTTGTVTSGSSASVPSGAVMAQSPVAGTLVSPGTAVNLVISTGPPPVAVPNVVNATQSAAAAALTAAGLAVGSITNASRYNCTVRIGDQPEPRRWHARRTRHHDRSGRLERTPARGRAERGEYDAGQRGRCHRRRRTGRGRDHERFQRYGRRGTGDQRNSAGRNLRSNRQLRQSRRLVRTAAGRSLRRSSDLFGWDQRQDHRTVQHDGRRRSRARTGGL